MLPLYSPTFNLKLFLKTLTNYWVYICAEYFTGPSDLDESAYNQNIPPTAKLALIII